jgi:hypothetical protein
VVVSVSLGELTKIENRQVGVEVAGELGELVHVDDFLGGVGLVAVLILLDRLSLVGGLSVV